MEYETSDIFSGSNSSTDEVTNTDVFHGKSSAYEKFCLVIIVGRLKRSLLHS
jgi:hypothetical protein